MDFFLSSSLYALALFAGMLAFGEAGRRLAHRRAVRDPDGTWQNAGVVDGAVFGLLGLIIAFTFSGAVSRFDARRGLIIEESNAIGTAYLRLGLLPVESQPALRESFRQYLDARIEFFRALPDAAAAKVELENGRRLQAEIWSRALAATHGSQPATMLLLPSLNQMFDMEATRTLSIRIHPPAIVFAMLFGVALIAAALAGYGMAKAPTRDWFRPAAFAMVTAFAFYVIFDIEYPRLGLIRVSKFDQTLEDLRSSMD